MAEPENHEALLAEYLVHPQFPRSAGFGLRWQFDNAMGPNPLWLLESLVEFMALEPGMRVLDLGCGKATTSVFLAREFGVTVVAADLWIDASGNWARVVEADCASQVLPLRAEAHDLKFAHGYFDAIVSVDAYHYFGTDDLYLPYLLQFLRDRGQLGIVVPSLATELSSGPPEHLSKQWDWDFYSFHSPDWWRRHWSKLGKVDVEHADLVPDGWRHWLRWEQLNAVAGRQEWRKQAAGWAANLAKDAGRTLGFARVVARKRSAEA